jgi:hypothetical protein
MDKFDHNDVDNKYKNKYLKYKHKYLLQKNKIGGGTLFLDKRSVLLLNKNDYNIFINDRYGYNYNNFIDKISEYMYYINIESYFKSNSDENSILRSKKNALTVSYDIQLDKKYNNVQEFIDYDLDYVVDKLYSTVNSEKFKNDTWFGYNYDGYKYEYALIVKKIGSAIDGLYSIINAYEI